MNLDDIGVLHSRRRRGLDAEPGALRGTGQRAIANELESDPAFRLQLARFINDAHAAAPQLAHDLVAGDSPRGGGVGRPAPSAGVRHVVGNGGLVHGLPFATRSQAPPGTALPARLCLALLPPARQSLATRRT